MLVIFHFDILSFYQNKVEKSLNNIGDNYKLKWYYDLPDNATTMNEKEYHYSPFRVLINKLHSKKSFWFIEVPLHVIMFNNENDRRARVFFEPGPEASPDESIPGAYIDILDNGKSLIQTKEYYLTLQWLLSLLLLIGIGAAYLVIMQQISGLKNYAYVKRNM